MWKQSAINDVSSLMWRSECRYWSNQSSLYIVRCFCSFRTTCSNEGFLVGLQMGGLAVVQTFPRFLGFAAKAQFSATQQNLYATT